MRPSQHSPFRGEDRRAMDFRLLPFVVRVRYAHRAWPTILLVAAFGLCAASGRAQAQGTGRISGTVTDASTGAPLADITVKVVTSDGVSGGVFQTDASGVYTTADIAVGTYYLRTLNGYPYLDELYNDLPCPGASCWELSGTGVVVTADTTVSGVDFRLTPGGTIRGTVRDSQTGAPLANISVRVFTGSGEIAGSIVTTNPFGEDLLARTRDGGLPCTHD